MASTKITRTQVTGSTNGTKIFTISVWFKVATTTTTQSCIWSSGTASTDSIDLHIDATNQLTFESWDGSSNPKLQLSRKLRDPAAWYHVVMAVDSTEAVDTNRLKMWVNGVQETAFGSSTYPTLNYDFPGTGVASDVTTIGVGTQGSYTGNYFNGVMSHFHFIEGTAYGADTFGETDSTSGIWKINTAPSVTYGNNGFFLKFEDSSNMDLDSSPNALTFTTTGELTSTKDNPSNNFCAINPLWTYGSSITINDASTNFTGSQGNAWRIMGGSLAASTGKYYYEVKINTVSTNNSYSIGWYSTHNLPAFDGAISPWVTYIGDINGPAAGLGKAGTLDYSTSSANSQTDTGWTTYTTGDTICCAIDLTNNFMYWGIDGVWMKSGDPTSGSTGTGGFAFDNAGTYFWFPAFGSTETASGSTCHMASNFGQGYFGNVTGAPTLVATPGTNASNNGIFEYDVPTGYTALCTEGLND